MGRDVRYSQRVNSYVGLFKIRICSYIYIFCTVCTCVYVYVRVCIHIYFIPCICMYMYTERSVHLE